MSAPITRVPILSSFWKLKVSCGHTDVTERTPNEESCLGNDHSVIVPRVETPRDHISVFLPVDVLLDLCYSPVIESFAGTPPYCVVARLEDFIAKKWGRTGANLYGYDSIIRRIPFSPSTISGGEWLSMNHHVRSGNHLMYIKYFDLKSPGIGITSPLTSSAAIKKGRLS